MIALKTREGALMTMLIPPNREVNIVPLTFGRARITVGALGASFNDDQW